MPLHQQRKSVLCRPKCRLLLVRIPDTMDVEVLLANPGEKSTHDGEVRKAVVGGLSDKVVD